MSQYLQHFGLTHAPLGKQCKTLVPTHNLETLKTRFQWVLDGKPMLFPPMPAENQHDTPDTGSSTPQVTIFFATPILTKGEVVAVLCQRVDPHSDHLSDITRLGRISTTGETFVFDTESA